MQYDTILKLKDELSLWFFYIILSEFQTIWWRAYLKSVKNENFLSCTGFVLGVQIILYVFTLKITYKVAVKIISFLVFFSTVWTQSIDILFLFCKWFCLYSANWGNIVLWQNQSKTQFFVVARGFKIHNEIEIIWLKNIFHSFVLNSKTVRVLN